MQLRDVEIEQKGKRTHDMDNSVMVAGGESCIRGINGNGKI